MADMENKVRSGKEVQLIKAEPGLVTIRESASILLERMDPKEAHM